MSTATKDPRPIEPGPPRIKGLALMNLVAAMKAVRDDAAEAVSEELRPYLAGRILVSSWYPERHQFELMRILAGWIERPDKDVWRYLGRKNAEADLGGIYSAMVLSGRPAATFLRAPRIWRLYRDTGVQTVRDVDETAGRGVVELRDYPFAGPEMARLVAGYYEEMLRRAGAVDPELVPETSDASGASGAAMVWHASWST